MIFGGSRDPEDLTAYSTLIGDRHEQLPTFDMDGSEAGATLHRVPIQSPAEIARLPYRRVIVIHRGMPPVIGRIQVAWKRLDVRAAKFAERMAERSERWSKRRERAVQVGTTGLAALNKRLDSVNARMEARSARKTGTVSVPPARTGTEPFAEFEAEFVEPRTPIEDDGRWS